MELTHAKMRKGAIPETHKRHEERSTRKPQFLLLSRAFRVFRGQVGASLYN